MSDDRAVGREPQATSGVFDVWHRRPRQQRAIGLVTWISVCYCHYCLLGFSSSSTSSTVTLTSFAICRGRRASLSSLLFLPQAQAKAAETAEAQKASPSAPLAKLPPGSRVLDLGGLLSASVEQDLEKAIDLLERDTPYRFRLVCPPPGYGPQDKALWSDFVKSAGQYFAQEAQWDPANAVVLLVSPRTSAGRTANLLNFSVATKLTQRLQYRIASDTFTKISNKYGDSQFVRQAGEGEAAALAAMNAIACLRKGVCMQPLRDDEAREVAFERKAAVSTAEALAVAGM